MPQLVPVQLNFSAQAGSGIIHDSNAVFIDERSGYQVRIGDGQPYGVAETLRIAGGLRFPQTLTNLTVALQLRQPIQRLRCKRSMPRVFPDRIPRALGPCKWAAPLAVQVPHGKCPSSMNTMSRP